MVSREWLIKVGRALSLLRSTEFHEFEIEFERRVGQPEEEERNYGSCSSVASSTQRRTLAAQGREGRRRGGGARRVLGVRAPGGRPGWEGGGWREVEEE